MGLQFRFKVPLGKRAWLNLSKSGVSASARLGRVTVNSRGSVWVRLLKGVFWRSSRSD